MKTLASLLLGMLWMASPAALISGPQLTLNDLHARFEQKKTTIVLVPGHDPVQVGSAFKNYTEAEINFKLAEYLKEYLNNDGRFRVLSTREGDGGWSNWLRNYVVENQNDILRFAVEKKQIMRDAIAKGEASAYVPIDHVDAPSDTRLYLYGINKYGNDIGADVLLHIHFNDMPRARVSEPGKYSGFAIYVPEAQYGNAVSTRPLAASLQAVLSQVIPGSNYPKERAVTVEDQELIAIGVDNQRAGPSLLIEYSYIYEPQIRTSAIRELILKEYAYQTYRGLLAFFDPGAEAPSSDTTILPHRFGEEFGKKSGRSHDTLALQYALKKEGAYPPPGKTFNECPLSGLFGPCTEQAVILFQKKKFGEGSGWVGEKTLAYLNERYGD